MISIIIPVYNTEYYLHRCIDSCLAQTFTDFEILLIDDGSTDKSGLICDEYKDDRIKVFHKANGGVMSARKLGVEKSIGEWITFVDSDDELNANALSVLYNNVTSGIDIVVTDLPFESTITSVQYVELTLSGALHNSVWGNLYKKTLLTEWVMNIPPIIKYGEDGLMNIRIGLVMSHNQVKCVRDKIYLYRQNPSSVLNTRIMTLEYEELYIKELTHTLGDRIEEFRSAYYLSNLYTLENLIVCKVFVDYKTPWIRELSQWYKNKPLTFRQWVVLYIKNSLLSKYILAIEKRIREMIKLKEKVNL